MADRFEKVGELALTELERRLEKDPSSLPATELMKFANSYAKLLSDREAELALEGDVQDTSALEAILEAGLPAKRTAALLTDLLARIDEDRDKVLAKLEELA